jgi:hypothetical protein
MSKGRDKVAESLNDILQMISSRKRNGLLSLERYHAGRFEEGEIYFEKGRPAQAFFEMLSGQDALALLSGWRNVYYSFTADVPVPASPPMSPRNTGNVPPYTTEPIVQQRYTTGPVRQTNDVPPISPLRYASQNRSATGPQPPIRQTGPQQFQPPEGGVVRERTTGGYNPPSEAGTTSWGFSALVPRRLSSEQNVLALPLTRPQRSVYLLVDGVRTVADLVRCTGKGMQDVERVLMELRQQGLIGF